jgi:antitoxin ParD1/3/4
MLIFVPELDGKGLLMPTRNVVLTDHHEDVIDRLVKSGRYQNASEVMREGLRMIEQRESREAAKLEALREAARAGFADLDEGRFDDVPANRLEDYIGGLGQEGAARARKAGGA